MEETITGALVIITAAVKNTMECMQTISSKHDAWRKNMDGRCAACGFGNKPSK
jgi:hypothetical protein